MASAKPGESQGKHRKSGLSETFVFKRCRGYTIYKSMSIIRKHVNKMVENVINIDRVFRDIASLYPVTSNMYV